MNQERFFLFLSIVLIFLLLLITEFQKPIILGKIEKISGKFPIRIYLENRTEEIILFEIELDLEKGRIIEIYGSKQSEGEIIANKIKCLNC